MNPDMIISSEALRPLPGIRHGFFSREGGVSSGDYASLNCGLGSDDDPELVKINRARIAASLDVEPDCLLSVYQIHSATAEYVTGPFISDEIPKADALVTDRPGLAIGILTADCTPVLFADPEQGVIGAAHAGWKGALGGVLESTIELMESLGAKRANIIAAIGPAISWKAYQVGPEFWDTFMESDEESESFFRDDQVTGRFQFDLPGYVEHRLRKLKPGQITNSNLCTYSEEALFFSFRRATHRQEPDYGRQISAISLSASQE